MQLTVEQAHDAAREKENIVKVFQAGKRPGWPSGCNGTVSKLKVNCPVPVPLAAHPSTAATRAGRRGWASHLLQSVLSVQNGGVLWEQGSEGGPGGRGWPPLLQRSVAPPALAPSGAAWLPAPLSHASPQLTQTVPTELPGY